MKLIIAIIIIVHGGIHLMGFAKGFGLSEIKQITAPISKTSGAFWLLAFILFLISGILLSLNQKFWWTAAIPAVLISQALIFICWQDAKFGTIANMIVMTAVVAGFATWNFHKKYEEDIQKGVKSTPYFPSSNLTEADMQHLPEQVKKYIRFTGSTDKPKVNNFRIVFTGKIRKDEQSAWMPFTSEQYNFMGIASRYFFMNASMKNLPVAGYHRFENGDAFMDIRLFSLIRVQFMEGEEMDMAETVTFFNDMCCLAPATLIDKRITWKIKDEHAVTAVFSNNGITISADLFFNQDGALVNFISGDRYAADAGKKLKWATPLYDYKEINGYRLAGKAETIYTYPDREMCYGTFEVQSITYNVTDYK